LEEWLGVINGVGHISPKPEDVDKEDLLFL
jgi:hypothetical protein